MTAQYAMDDFCTGWDVKRMDAVCVIGLRGELEYSASGERTMAKVLSQIGQGEAHVLLDLSSATFVNASICRFIVALYKRCMEKNVEAGLIVPWNHTALDVLRESGIGRIMKTHASFAQFRCEQIALCGGQVLERVADPAGPEFETVCSGETVRCD